MNRQIRNARDDLLGAEVLRHYSFTVVLLVFENPSKLMSSSKTVSCHCPKCNGMLVSVRTERNHRNGPAIRQVEAAQRKPGRQKHRRTVAGPSLSSDDNPELPDDHPNTGAGNGGVDIDMDTGRDQIVMTKDDALPVRHSIFL